MIQKRRIKKTIKAPIYVYHVILAFSSFVILWTFPGFRLSLETHSLMFGSDNLCLLYIIVQKKNLEIQTLRWNVVAAYQIKIYVYEQTLRTSFFKYKVCSNRKSRFRSRFKTLNSDLDVLLWKKNCMIRVKLSLDWDLAMRYLNYLRWIRV